MRHIVLDEDPALPPLKGHSPQFSPNVCCDQTVGWNKMPLGMKIGFGPGDFVFNGDPATHRKKDTHPTQCLVHVYCGQTAGWMKTPLGTEVDLGPGHIVLDGVPAPRESCTAAPRLFSAHVYCGHGRSSQLLLISCIFLWLIFLVFYSFSVPAKRLAGKSISEMTYVCLVGCTILTQSSEVG